MFGTLCVAKSEFSTHRSRLFIVIVHSHRDVCHIIRLMLDFQSVISTSVVFHSEHDLEKKKNEQKTEKKKKIIGERKTVTQKEIFMEGKVK